MTADSNDERMTGDAPAPSSPDFNVGARLRAFRLQSKLSMDEVAARAGVSKSFLSRFERDLVQSSIATLLRICDAIGVKPAAIFEPPRTNFVRANEGAPINLGGVGMRERIIGGVDNEHMMALHSTIEPGGGSGDEAYSLRADQDLVHILTGRLTVTVGDETYLLTAGDTLSFDPKTPHTWCNPSETEACTAIWMIVPPPG
ncbi:helix-turn-helix domain-containing protein [Azospirillum sp. ST 5-10]|uniref:helix-turn-helix domain-containing protein n=1 Tax=unclassified Azospirillum TaxID=2630922 RepID=UPI003F49E629